MFIKNLKTLNQYKNQINNDTKELTTYAGEGLERANSALITPSNRMSQWTELHSYYTISLPPLNKIMSKLNYY